MHKKNIENQLRAGFLMMYIFLKIGPPQKWVRLTKFACKPTNCIC